MTNRIDFLKTKFDEKLKKLKTSVDSISKYDPSPKKKFTQWLVNGVLSKKIKIEDLYKAEEYLTLFAKHFNFLKVRDINQYQTLGQVFKAVKPHRENVSKNEEERQLKETMHRPDYTTVLYDSPEIKVVIPHNKASSCYWGRNTEWCTSAKKNNAFQYYNKSGPLYIILLKKNNKRYQFHFIHEQYMDENDEPINLGEFLASYPEILPAFKDHITFIEGGYIISTSSGNKYYNNSGKFHRLDGPAVKWINGTEEWYCNGVVHREDGPAIIGKVAGRKMSHEWYRHGRRHREDGPARMIFHIVGKIKTIVEEEWFQNGLRHRDDGPAIVKGNNRSWYQHGKLHREDGPAIEDAHGNKNWYINGKAHRDKGPAVLHTDGTKKWYQNGELHRDRGPAIIRVNGTKEWFQNGLRHRENGPAIEGVNIKRWFKNGELHRARAPAIIWEDGHKEWWQNGIRKNVENVAPPPFLIALKNLIQKGTLVSYDPIDMGLNEETIKALNAYMANYRWGDH